MVLDRKTADCVLFAKRLPSNIEIKADFVHGFRF